MEKVSYNELYKYICLINKGIVNLNDEELDFIREIQKRVNAEITTIRQN